LCLLRCAEAANVRSSTRRDRAGTPPRQPRFTPRIAALRHACPRRCAGPRDGSSKRVDSPPARDYSARALSPADGFLGHFQREMDSIPSRCVGDRKPLRMPALHNPMNACDRLRSARAFLD